MPSTIALREAISSSFLHGQASPCAAYVHLVRSRALADLFNINSTRQSPSPDKTAGVLDAQVVSLQMIASEYLAHARKYAHYLKVSFQPGNSWNHSWFMPEMAGKIGPV
jgi:hypothetical protein